jgi:hypothetical protein
VEAATPGPSVSGPDEAAQKYAMLSVYYAAPGREFAISGAPSIFVPPEVTPQSLASALEVLSEDEQRLEQALWLIVRNTPVRPAWSTDRRYPPEINAYLDQDEQDELDARRRSWRRGASLLAACVSACRNGDRPQFDALRGAMSAPAIRTNSGFAKLARLLFDQMPAQFLEEAEQTSTDPDRWERARDRITAIETEIGVGIGDYVEQLAATAAYESFVDLLQHRSSTRHPVMTVYPVSSVIKQSTDQLWTSATVTTLARGDFETLYAATEPANWHIDNDVIKTSHYVDDPLSLERVHTDLGNEGKVHGLLYEEAAISWGRGSGQQGSFRNVLNVSRKAVRGRQHDRSFIDLTFSLCRSISSEVLWDSRHGGIMLNEGFMRVRPLGGGRWRVTSRKLLRFSDRTPYTGASGWADFGQMLNYLAPAALSWWVETETYGLGQRTGHDLDLAPAAPPVPESTSEDGPGQ